MVEMIDGQIVTLKFVNGEEARYFFAENPNPLTSLLGHWLSEGAAAVFELPAQRVLISFSQVASICLSDSAMDSRGQILTLENITKLQ